MEQCSGEAHSCSVTQVSSFLWNLKFRCCIHKGLFQELLDPEDETSMII
jgi:hypothetical protein